MIDLSDFDIDAIRKLIAEDERVTSAELKLSGEKDRTNGFQFRDAKQNACCRACKDTILKGNKMIWASGGREAVILCIPCVRALSRLIRNILE